MFQKQKNQNTFQQRVLFEKLAKARFSATIRRSMRDETIFTSQNVWLERDADLASALLRFVQARKDLKDTNVCDAFLKNTNKQDNSCEHWSPEAATRVWERLLTQFPHDFAVARARGTLNTHMHAKDVAACSTIQKPLPTFSMVGL